MSGLQHGFWTAYRLLLVETWMARGVSRAAMAERLGVTRRQVTSVISYRKLRPRELLARTAGGDDGH